MTPDPARPPFVLSLVNLDHKFLLSNLLLSVPSFSLQLFQVCMSSLPLFIVSL